MKQFLLIIALCGSAQASGGLRSQDYAFSLSSAPIAHVGGGIFISLTAGTTFAAFVPDSAITLRRMTITIIQASVGGGGDTVKCNDSTGNGISATSSNAATAGTVTSTAGTASIAVGATVSCHVESTAVTKPFLIFLMEYVMQ